MRSLRWMLGLGLGLALASCRSEAGGPSGDTDAGPGDTGTPPTDMVVVAMDQPSGNDACVASGAENTAAACMDNLDNDCNGFTDCRDFSCSRDNPMVNFCPDAGMRRDGGGRRDIGPCTATGMENTAAACTDGVDNDCDGFRDCVDFDCPRATCPRDGGTRIDTGPCTSSPENTAAACTDGVDNDCDGFRDCVDFDCPRATCPRDGGAATDRGNCIATGPENTAAACGDGIDNDCNRFVDCADFACQTCAVPACIPDGGLRPRDGGVCVCTGAGVENSDATCGDGVDNDCDGFTDCRDFSCSRSDGGVGVCPTDAGAARD